MAQGDGTRTAFEVANAPQIPAPETTPFPVGILTLQPAFYACCSARGTKVGSKNHRGKPVPVRQCYLCKGLKMDRYNSYRYRYKKNKTGVIGTFSTGVAPFGLLNPDNPDNPDNDFRDPLV